VLSPVRSPSPTFDPRCRPRSIDLPREGHLQLVEISARHRRVDDNTSSLTYASMGQPSIIGVVRIIVRATPRMGGEVGGLCQGARRVVRYTYGCDLGPVCWARDIQ
jgi:hypothetical protein